MHKHVFVSGGEKRLFFEKSVVLCFLLTPILRFALLPCYYRRNMPEYGFSLIRTFSYKKTSILVYFIEWLLFAPPPRKQLPENTRIFRVSSAFTKNSEVSLL